MGMFTSEKINRWKKTITTDASGDATDYLLPEGESSGRIIGIMYDKVDYAAGVDFTITTEVEGIGVWTESDVNASKNVFPTMLVQDQVGVDTTQRDYIPFSKERIKVVIAQGGDTKTGDFTLLWV